MGICYKERNKLNKKLFSGELYTNFDKTIFLQKLYMDNNLSKEELSPFFTPILYNQIIEEKKSKIKLNRFFKWYNMAFTPYDNLLSFLQKETILKSLNLEKKRIEKKQIENEEELSYSEIPYFSQEISISEQGLRNYFFSNRNHFEKRILKSPPGSFRWISWIIMSGVPISRPIIYYTNLLTYDLPEKVEDQIQKDLGRTMHNDELNYNEKVSSLYRILRAIANLDKELAYTQGMNFLVSFLLKISNINEIEVFYLLISIFSNTFSEKYGMRGFFIDNFPLLHTYTNIFDKKLKEYIPNVYKHFEKINFTSLSWISFWMQQIYIIVFPPEILLRIWDYFFVYGKNFLISFGLSIIDLLQDEIIQIYDISELQEFFGLLDPNNSIKNKKVKFSSIEYDIEKILKNSIEKYFIKDEEIQNEIKNLFPNYNNEFVYDYKSVESNPNVKYEFAFYALNNSKIFKNFSNSTDTTMKNSLKLKNIENPKNVSKFNEQDNKSLFKKNKIFINEDSFDMDSTEEENDFNDDFHQVHFKEIKLKQNIQKKIYKYK